MSNIPPSVNITTGNRVIAIPILAPVDPEAHKISTRKTEGDDASMLAIAAMIGWRNHV